MLERVAIFCSALVLASVVPCDVRAEARSEAETHRLLTARNFARGGYYIGLSGLFALENSPDVRSQLATGGVNLRLGARHNRWLATEFNSLYVHKFEGEDETYFAWGLGINERVYATKARIQPFVLAGLGFLQIRAEDEDFRAGRTVLDTSPGFTPGFSTRFGAGVELYFTEEFAITLDAVYHLTVGHINDHDFISVGAGMQFF